ncbi:MAG: DnaB-like helicase C-terminal domain-containing protein [bacterium]
MVQKSSKTLTYTHIKKPTKEIISYIDNRRKGVISSLKTRWPKFNRNCMGGIEPNVILTIAGISGSGKSSFANTLETDLIDLNPQQDVVVLSFSYEMLSSKQVGRKLSYKLKKTTSELYSGVEDPKARLKHSDYEEIVKQAEKIEKYPIFYVDSPGTIEEMRNTILHFMDKFPDKWLIIFLDHSLLVKSNQGDKEREMLADLQKMFMEMKKLGQNTIIQLSQLNRNIESSERITNPSLHYPMRSDLFGADSLFQASD